MWSHKKNGIGSAHIRRHLTRHHKSYILEVHSNIWLSKSEYGTNFERVVHIYHHSLLEPKILWKFMFFLQHWTQRGENHDSSACHVCVVVAVHKSKYTHLMVQPLLESMFAFMAFLPATTVCDTQNLCLTYLGFLNLKLRPNHLERSALCKPIYNLVRAQCARDC